MRLAIQSATLNRASVGDVVAEVHLTAELGLAGYWAPMLAGQDSLTVLALAGREVGGIELGTAILPMPLRSPFALAMQMRTVQEVVAGRLTVALGTSHQALVTGLFGAEWLPPLARARSYVDELRSITSGTGERRLAGPPVPPTDILLGAVNPAMIRLAAEVAEGVVTWAAGAATAELIRDTARDAGRGDSFRIVTALPVIVTDDAEAGRQYVHERLGANDRFPSYQRVLEREGVSGVAELAVVGSESEVRDRIARFADSGVTDFAAHPLGRGADELRRTWDSLGSVAAEVRS
jgi:F420-dependent oxidoreductase-like protein